MSVTEGKNPTSLRMKFDLGKDELTNKTKVNLKLTQTLNPKQLLRQYTTLQLH